MNKIYLLDTCVVSEIAKPDPNFAVVNKILQTKDLCAISVITYQEILFGIRKMPIGHKRAATEDFFYNKILTNFAVLDYGTFSATVYADFQANAEKRGLPRPLFDTQIAATAKANALILVTRNVKDFEPFVEHENLMVENWFE